MNPNLPYLAGVQVVKREVYWDGITPAHARRCSHCMVNREVMESYLLSDGRRLHDACLEDFSGAPDSLDAEEVRTFFRALEGLTPADPQHPDVAWALTHFLPRVDHTSPPAHKALALALREGHSPEGAVALYFDLPALQLAWEANKATKPPESHHFGTVGQRAEWELLLTRKIGPQVGQWGERWGYVFLVDDNNIAVWWTGGSPGIEIGEKKKFRCTIKAHTEYLGVRQTELSRCQGVK